MEMIVEKLQLSEEEYTKLKNTYGQTMIGDMDYVCHQKILEFFQILKQRREEFSDFQEDTLSVKQVDLPAFLQLNNKLEILRWVQNALDYLHLNEGKEKKLCLNMQVMHSEILMLLEMFCSYTQNCNIEEIVYLMRDNPDSDSYNLDVLKNMAEILIQRNAIELFCLEKTNAEMAFSVNCILSEEFVIWFDDELSGGMLTTAPEWIDFFMQAFEKTKEISRHLGRKSYTLQNHISFYTKNFAGKSIEYMPCIGWGLTKEIMEQHIYANIPDRDKIMQNVLAYCQSYAQKNHSNWKSFFFMEGLIEFMETGYIENVPDMFFERPNLKTRCEVLQNIINFSEQRTVPYYMVKEDALPVMKDLYIEQVEGDVLTIVIDVHFDDVRERCIIEDNELGRCFEKFFAYLETGGYVYSVEETIERMKEVLAKYAVTLL